MAGMFYIWGASRCPPYVWMPNMFGCPNTLTLPICSNTPYVPNAPLCICMLWGVSACDWGMWGPSFCLDTPMCLDASPCVQDLHNFYMLPCMSMFKGLLHALWGKHPIYWGTGGFSTYVRLLVSISTSFGCPLCFILCLSCSSLCLKSLLPGLQLLPLQ